MDALSRRVGAAISHRQGRFANQSLPRPLPVVEDASRLEVAYLLRDAVESHLAGCHKVVLYDPNDEDLGTKFSDVAETLLRVWGDALVLWEVEAFLTTPPPPFFTLKTKHLGAERQYCAAFVILARLEAVAEVFAEIQQTSWFLGTAKYILSYTAQDISKETLAAEPILGTSYDFVLVSRTTAKESGLQHLESSSKDTNLFALLQNCPYCDAGDPRVNLVDVWSPSGGFLMGRALYPDLFRDFNGHKFRAVTLVYEPFSCYEKIDDVIIPADNCVDNNMLREISMNLNFTYVFVEPSDGQWGHRLDNGSYTGVIGAVERREADFSLNIAITQDREEKVDCTIGYHVEPITFATSKPRPLNQALALIRPFAPRMWAAFSITLVVTGPLYFLICKFTVAPFERVTPPTLVKSYLIIFAACFNQGVKWLPVFSNRVFGMTYVITMFVTVTVYVAMLTATLTLPTLSPTLNTLEELVQSDFSWGIQDLGAADYQLLKSSKVPLYQEVFKGLQPCPSLDGCITQARDSKYAFITWRTYLEDRIAVRFTSATGERQLHVATGDIFPVELGWAMNPGCPYRHAFNRKIRALLQSGLISGGGETRQESEKD
ncbi:glutamate receptor ionotropic, kainate 2-like [Penaeus japonicus]|uniref:glutamate receptor ionotropic, kainate 2-like n=1 Tax=Penaeus japonicus TaxID=27405 RepID=UPI001C70D4D2|nr:glutamate receptor ionotropic, kainate 2-like [Penaeus japonicus]